MVPLTPVMHNAFLKAVDHGPKSYVAWFLGKKGPNSNTAGIRQECSSSTKNQWFETTLLKCKGRILEASEGAHMQMKIFGGLMSSDPSTQAPQIVFRNEDFNVPFWGGLPV